MMPMTPDMLPEYDSFSPRELADLSREAGRELSASEAMLYLIRKRHREAVHAMLDEEERCRATS